MTRKSDEVKVVRKIVVFFDICSSTTILENLKMTDNETRWRNFLIDFKDYLIEQRSSVRFIPYKFLGDGWILLFKPQSEGMAIFQLLENLSDKFDSLYKRRIRNVQSTRIANLGLTFGMDIGDCIRFRMNGRPEYVGRPLNVAGRLQGNVGQKEKKPQNKALVSKNLFATFKDKRKIMDKYTVRTVKSQLNNISRGKEMKRTRLNSRHLTLSRINS